MTWRRRQPLMQCLRATMLAPMLVVLLAVLLVLAPALVATGAQATGEGQPQSVFSGGNGPGGHGPGGHGPGGHGPGGNGSGGHGPGGGHSGDCSIKEVISVTPVVANLGTYQPPEAAAALPLAITVDLKTRGRGTCKGAITFYRQGGLPGRMTRLGGGQPRTYTIGTAPGGGASLMFASWPPVGRTLDFTVQGGSGTQRHTVTLNVYVTAASGWLAAGNYSDSVLMKVLDRSRNGYDIVKYQTFTVTSVVQQLCDLPPPDLLNLDFTSTISNGLPGNATLIATFSGVACSAPARIRLSGEPLINPAIPPAANFDNFIDWEASADFGNAHVALDTRVTNQATSATQNVASGPTQSATITLSVRLLAGRRVIAGHYSNILTVTIDPAL
jgi:hypothetical protein